MALSTGAVVGVVVGVAVGVALVSAFAGYYLTVCYTVRVYAPRVAEVERRLAQRTERDDGPSSHLTKFQRQQKLHFMARTLMQFLPVRGDVSQRTADDRDNLMAGAKHYVKHYIDPKADVQVDVSTFADLVGGSPDEWSLLAGPNPDRERMLVVFMCRFAQTRMRADGDPATTILPQDLCIAYQRVMTSTAEKLSLPLNGQWWEGENFILIARQFWAGLTVRFGEKTLPRWGVDFWRNNPSFEDSRMPNVVSMEETLRRVLAPFDKNSDPNKRQDSEKGKIFMRQFTTCAVNLAMTVFSSPLPLEFFWPDPPMPEQAAMDPAEKQAIFDRVKETQRKSYIPGTLCPLPVPERPYDNVRCFGIRGMNMIPGTQMEANGDVVLPTVHLEPYDDEYWRKWLSFEQALDKLDQARARSLRGE